MAPIYDHAGRVVAALKVSGPAARFTGEARARCIRAAPRASRHLTRITPRRRAGTG